MSTVNEILLERAISHQIYLQNLSSSEVKKIRALLLKIEAGIIGRLSRRELTDLSTTQQQILLRAIRKLTTDGYKPVKKAIRKASTDLAIYEATFQTAAIQAALPVAWDLIVPSPAQLRAAVSNVPYNGKPMKEWLNRMAPATAQRVVDTLREGWAEGATTETIIRRLRGTRAGNYEDGVLGISRRSAEMVTRTTMNATANVARSITYRDNADLIKGVQWVATLDTKTSAICRSRDGTVYPPDKGPRPPAHPNCRSTTAPVIKSWKELGINLSEAPEGTRASMDGQVPASMNYDDWLRKQNKARQDEVLGKHKAILFRRGELPIQRFVDKSGNELTLDQLREREPAAWRDAFSGRQ